MDIHKPKSWPSWRVVLTDFVIVVLGVGVALAAQQAVEKMHDNSRAAEARASIRAEIARNVAFMIRRDITEGCTAKRLDEVDGLITDSVAGKLPQDALWIGMPVMSAMVDGSYKAALQSGAVSLLGDRERAAYTGLYLIFEHYNKETADEMLVWANLRTLEKHPPPSPVLDWQLRSAVQAARTHRYMVNADRLMGKAIAARMGIAPRTFDRVKMPATCVPLHTSRDEALKLTFDPNWVAMP